MRAGVNKVLACGVLAAIAGGRAAASELNAQAGSSRWVPSFAITSGAAVQRQSGLQSSLAFDGETNTQGPLRPPVHGRDAAISPYVGGALEVMTPALPLPWRPRLFATGEILPTFAPERQVQDAEPSRIRGPELNTVLAVEETSMRFTTDRCTLPQCPRGVPFSQGEAKGDGMRLRYQVEPLAYGAKAGVAFAFEFRGRQFRLKPSLGWIHYDVNAKGLLVTATCNPTTRCTNTYNANGTLRQAGSLRETILTASDSGTFDGVGPGLDLEMDTLRVGPLGTALFVGVHGYYIPGDRDIDFSVSRTYDDVLSPSAAVDVNSASWQLRVAPWMYRAGVGIRFHWLGGSD